jgi:hypothetical protein
VSHLCRSLKKRFITYILSLDVDSVNEKPLQNDLQHSFVAQVFYTVLQLQYMFKFCPYVNPTCLVFITSLSLGFMQMLCKVSSSCFISSFGLEEGGLFYSYNTNPGGIVWQL